MIGRQDREEGGISNGQQQNLTVDELFNVLTSPRGGRHGRGLFLPKIQFYIVLIMFAEFSYLPEIWRGPGTFPVYLLLAGYCP